MSAPALLVLLAVGLSPAGPRSLALRSEVFAPEARPAAEDVEAFVTERMMGSWGLAPVVGPAQFTVTLAWAAREQVRIQIKDDERVWVDRPLPVDDPSATRAMVWLLVRSTVERVLLRAAPEDPTPPIAQAVVHVAPAAPVPGSGVAVEALPAGEGDDFLDPPATATATLAEAPTPPDEAPPAPATPAVAPAAAVAPTPGLSRLWRAPFALAPGERLSAALVMRAYADPNTGFGWGPAASARLQLANRFLFGGELGYRSERADSLDIDHVPLTLLAGYVFESIPVEVGAATSLDLRVVTAQVAAAGQPNERSGLAAGLTAGAYARAFYPVYTKDASELRLVADAGLRFALLRSAYVVNEQRQEDAVVSFSTGLGLEWRWR
jgi:hypothetical protein